MIEFFRASFKGLLDGYKEICALLVFASMLPIIVYYKSHGAEFLNLSLFTSLFFLSLPSLLALLLYWRVNWVPLKVLNLSTFSITCVLNFLLYYSELTRLLPPDGWFFVSQFMGVFLNTVILFAPAIIFVVLRFFWNKLKK